jgi:murein DD-endopeptidase MepM/ murein hydrolase activator NlpD
VPAEAIDDHAPGIENSLRQRAVSIDHDDSYVYRLPYADDVAFPVLQSYGSRLTHVGSERFTVDFAMPVGTPVHAARGGEVIAIEARQDRACFQSGCGRYANRVAIRHDDGTIGWYFHLAKASVLVNVGDRVRRGQLIASSGNTGYSNVPHLHFGVYAELGRGELQSIDVAFDTSGGVVRRLRPGGLYKNAVEAAHVVRE